MTKRVLIIGSGFAGLTLATFLKRQGYTTTVYEAQPGHQQLGGTITIFPNGMKVLHQLGVDLKIRKRSAVINSSHFRDHWGKDIITRVLGSEEGYGQPTIFTRRADLAKTLLDAALDEGVEIVYGKKLVTVTESNEKAFVRFEDGTSTEGLCVIGADGINSSVRKYVDPSFTEPSYSKLIYFAGFVPADKITETILPRRDEQQVIVGPSGFFTYSLIDEKGTLLWSSFLPQEERLSRKQLDLLSDEEVKRRVLKICDGWCEPIPTLVNSTSLFSKASIYDVVDLKQWSRGRVLIIGDAAHAVNPVSGQGISLAMEDSFLLSQMMSGQQAQDLSKIFQNFEKIRTERVYKIAKTARKSSDRLQMKFSPLGCWLRNRAYALMIKCTPEKVQNWALLYDVRRERTSLPEMHA
jgi:2-polyprenyl-6-methoxyphenol hydroxylase-like FAD-dependent oxidoreductase